MKHKLIKIFLILAFSLAAKLAANLLKGSFNKFGYMPELDQKTNAMAEDFGAQMQRKYGLRFISFGGSAIGNLTRLESVGFQLNKSLTKDEARKLLIEVSLDFLRRINDDPELQKFLIRKPFRTGNIRLQFIFAKEDWRDVYEPYVSSCGLSMNTVDFSIRRQKDSKDPTDYEEHYIDAYALVHKSLTKEQRAMAKRVGLYGGDPDFAVCDFEEHSRKVHSKEGGKRTLKCLYENNYISKKGYERRLKELEENTDEDGNLKEGVPMYSENHGKD